MSELLVSKIMTERGSASIDYNALANLPVIDSELSENSTNAIQNSAVSKIINEIKGENTEQGSKLIEAYTHEKIGTVHNFNGKGSNGKSLITSDFVSGDTFAINGITVPAYCGTDEPDDDTIVNGQWVTFVYDGEQLNFSGGGGSSKIKVFEDGACVAKATLTIENGILVIREA